jgi:SAM-dependent methyltransferase
MIFLKKLYSYLYFHSWRLGLWTPPDRKLLQSAIFPFFAEKKDCQNILFVGWADFCQGYARAFAGKNFISIDPDKGKAPFAKDHQHFSLRVEDLNSQLAPGFRFDVIFLNGVLGYGTNQQDSAEEVLLSCQNLLKPGGWLMTGVNPHHLGEIEYHNLEGLKFFSPATPSFLKSSEIQMKFPFFPGLFHTYRFYRA